MRIGDTTQSAVQTQDCRGLWDLYPPHPLHELRYCGLPVALTESQTAHLLAGGVVRYGPAWYDNVRIAQPAPPAREMPRPAYTCLLCGEHRDTTLAGHCDDCE